MIVQYKCPDCGANMGFDSTTGNLHCDSCGRNDTIDNRKEGHRPNKEKLFNKKETQEFHCNNCGADVITDPLTTATTCSFCGANLVLSSRLEGRLEPEYVIPFKISKEEAMQAFKKWCRKGRLTPKGFMTADRVKNITGLYVPFWLYDLNCTGDANAHCTKVRTYTRGEYIYTETQHFDVQRKVNLSYNLVPSDASEKMNDELMEKIEPFHYNEMTEFKMPYLAGFLAENYSFDSKKLLPKIQDRVSSYVSDYISSTISGYTTVTVHNKNIHVSQKDAHYVLLPVWMVSYDYNKSEHIFAMNGQTGKIVGKPPISAGKVFAWFSGISAGSFIIIQLLSLLFGGNV